MTQGIDILNSINGVMVTAFIVTLNISQYSANQIPYFSKLTAYSYY